MQTVHVDIVEPGKARVTLPGGCGYIARDGKTFYATVDECDMDESRDGITSTLKFSTYRGAAQWISTVCGLVKGEYTIEIQRER